MFRHLTLTMLALTGCNQEASAPVVLLSAGSEAGLVVVATEDWAGRWQLEAHSQGDFAPLDDLWGTDGFTAGDAWFIPADRLGDEVQLTRIRFSDGALRRTEGIAPVQAQLDGTSTHDEEIRWPSETATVSVTDTSGALEGVPLQLSWQWSHRAPAATSPTEVFLADCVDGETALQCTSEERAFSSVDGTDLALTLAAGEQTGWTTIAATLAVRGQRPSGVEALVPVASVEVSLGVTDAAALAWGDLHVHTNLSNDGCEQPYHFCDSRDGVPASDVIDLAREAGLDFMALTEHAEWEAYLPDDGDDYDIWAEQQAIAAASTDPVVFLGYEWTNNQEVEDTTTAFEGGHKTVVFRDATACERYRVSASDDRDSARKLSRATYTGWHDPLAREPTQFFATLDQAAASCGDTEVMSFFHHSALYKPQPVDFASPNNAPDPRYERLVEIYSEHGCSECLEPEALDCSFQINDGYEYVARGAVQTALEQGYQLGFVGGTDAHDGRPGSLEDGPSYHGPLGSVAPEDSGDPSYLNLHFAPGALTGVWLEEEVSRTAVYDGLWDRATLATSGPRPAVSAWALGSDGVLYRSGMVVPQAAMPALFVARVDAADDEDTTVDAIRLVAADGEVEASSDESDRVDTLATTLAVPEAGALYWRVVAQWGGEPARLWVSPIFGGG